MKLHYLFTDKPLVIIPGVSKPKVGRHFVSLLRHGSPQTHHEWLSRRLVSSRHACLPTIATCSVSDLTLVLVSVDTLSKGNFGELPDHACQS